MKATRFDSIAQMEASQEDAIVPGYVYFPGNTEQSLHPMLWVVLPSGVGSRLAVGPAGWQVSEHDDGTISVTPSIWDAPDGWHGWLRRDEFVSA